MSFSANEHDKTNCLTEIMFDDALKRATELDDFYAKHGKTIGPLHGVVMTLKDQFDCEGFDSTLGYVGRAHRPADHDALLVEILKSLGAVFIAKTNLPQSIMYVKCGKKHGARLEMLSSSQCLRHLLTSILRC